MENEAMNKEKPSEKKAQRNLEGNEKGAAKKQAMRVTLPEDLAARVGVAIQKLKERGKDARVEELMSVSFESLTDEKLERRVEELTPDEYFLSRAKQDPALYAAIMRKVKGAYASPISNPSGRRGRRRKESVSTPELNGADYFASSAKASL